MVKELAKRFMREHLESAKVYRDFAESADDEEGKSFWLEMAEMKERHAASFAGRAEK